MGARVEWTESALKQLAALLDPIGDRQPERARRIIDRLFERAGHIAAFPRIAPPWPPANSEAVRRLVADDYVLFYELSEDEQVARIAWVQHSRQRPPSLAKISDEPT